MYVKLYFQIAYGEASTSSSLQFASFCLKYGFPTLKPTMPCNFWIDKELLICPKNFLKKSPCNFLFLQRSDSVHEFESE
jgi:hypothetical protein